MSSVLTEPKAEQEKVFTHMDRMQLECCTGPITKRNSLQTLTHKAMALSSCLLNSNIDRSKLCVFLNAFQEWLAKLTAS
jgi:hypothetical protein